MNSKPKCRPSPHRPQRGLPREMIEQLRATPIEELLRRSAELMSEEQMEEKMIEALRRSEEEGRFVTPEDTERMLKRLRASLRARNLRPPDDAAPK